MTTRKHYRWNYKKFLKTMYALISIALFVWVALSYIDIITHNLSGGTDAKWNLFTSIMPVLGLL